MSAINEACRAGRIAAVALAALLVSMGTSDAQSTKKLTVDANGAVHGPAYTVPWSSFASAEGKAFAIEIGKAVFPPGGPNADIATIRKAWDDQVMIPQISRQKELYPVNVEPQTIAGVYAEAFTPKDGVSSANARRVLINLHGGGFIMGARTEGAAESIPVASVGKIRVISVDYRQGPENKFPAASEDVAKVYKELLKTYKPRNIGIYGCSAGGMLAAQMIGWFDKEKLPQPGAIGIFCASAYGPQTGDSDYVAPMLGALGVPPAGNPSWGMSEPYFGDTAFDNPLAVPAASKDIMAKFPPTLLITGTRAGEMSAALRTHIDLVRAGVDAQIFVWDGMPHGFFYNPDLPESKEAYDIMVKFFDSRLGKRGRSY